MAELGYRKRWRETIVLGRGRKSSASFDAGVFHIVKSSATALRAELVRFFVSPRSPSALATLWSRASKLPDFYDEGCAFMQRFPETD
jgi:hypothetical protein